MKQIFGFLVVVVLVSTGSAQNGISIGVNGGIEYVVLDPLNRKEGIDPITNQHYKEINNSYGVFSIDSEDPDYQAPDPVNEFMTYNPVDGLYRLTLYGTKAARYRLFIVARSQHRGQGIDTYGLIDSNQVRVLEFNYSRDSTKPFVVKKLTNATSLREDISNCYKLGFLGHRSFYKELDEKAINIEKRMERDDSSKAYEELEKFSKELKKIWDQTQKHVERKEKPNRFLTREGYDILSEDAAILMSTLSPRKHHKDDERKDSREKDDRENKKKPGRD